MTWVFIFMAAVTFFVFAGHAARRNGHAMAYAFIVFLLWVIAAAWWAGGFA
jgi:hypothetical protein